MFVKLGESFELTTASIQSVETILSDDTINENFKKFAGELKKIAPKANDFLYFSAVMMHAAESALINDDGSLKLTKSGEPVKAGWDINGDSWKWNSNDPSIKPYKNCFAPGTLVLMSDGSVTNIEEIEPGDMVITHKGHAKRVVRKFITPHEGKLLELSVRHGHKILSTDNHPFYTLNVSSDTNKSNKNYEFVEAKNLIKGDILLSPVLAEQTGTELNANSAMLLGLFAAEGCYSKKYNKYQGVRFTFNKNERDTLGAKVEKLAHSIFPNCSVKFGKDTASNTVEISITGSGVVDFFRNNVGEYSEYKTLSRDLVFGSKAVKEAFLVGWLDGDGHIAKDFGQITGITTSKNMAYQIRCMLYSCGIEHSLRFIKSAGPGVINLEYGPTKISDSYRIEICASAGNELIKLSDKLNFTHELNTKEQNGFYDTYAINTINEINEIDYVGNVYNIEVEEDHSYVANGVVVANCNGDIFPEAELLKAYKNWVGKPLCVDHKSSSVDAIRGVILDTYYDRALKRVIALCALDKISYPELARKVSTGYSTSVSMGTAVGRAICSDCGKSARTEHEFCQHMRAKSCYGEINVDLQPIELSIVVSGADQKAKIRTILAAANNLNKYIETKETEINKLSSLDHEECLAKVQELEEDIKKSSEKLAELKALLNDASDDTNNMPPYGQSSGVLNDPGIELSDSGEGFKFPQRLASLEKDAILDELKSLKQTFGEKFEIFEKNLENLSNKLHTTKEEIMSDTKDAKMNKEAYFQGGGGVNEPEPGKVKYPKDPLQEHLREKEDKHMVGQSPFPEVGDVSGMHPSPASADDSNELERKKKLLRAEMDDRQMRREAALIQAKANIARSKEAYWQGGGGVNEPEPGKVKYPIDPLSEKLRLKEDKQMVGQKPFPDVGDVDGLHPSPMSADEKDELSRKKKLLRATPLKARFVKSANVDGTENQAKDAWHVFVDGKLVLTASVDEISGGRSEVLYDTIATKEFGTKMLEKIRAVGFEQAEKLYKSAQAVADMGAMPAAPADAGGAAPVPPMPEAGPANDSAAPADEDKGGKGDPKETVVALSEEVRDRASDLSEAVKAMVGEKEEMGAMEEMPKAASLAPLYNMRKELNASLTDGMRKAAAELREHEAELSLISGVLDDSTTVTSPEVHEVIAEAIKDAKQAVANSLELMGAFVKYARGTEGLLKMAEDSKPEELFAADVNDAADFAPVDAEADDAEFADDSADAEDEAAAGDANDADLLGDNNQLDADIAQALMADDQNDMKFEVDVDPAKMHAVAGFDLTTKAGRSAYRTKLAAESVQFSDMLGQAHKLTESTHLDTKPSDNLGHVETIEEAHKIDLEVARQATPKVRKEAERLNQLISEGKVNVEDLDKLIAQGVDPETVKYWKEMWGEAGKEGSEFAKLLTQESVKSKVAEEVGTYKVKIARAYELANEMIRRGYLADDKSAITAQVEEIMTWNDEAFHSMKRVIAKNALKKAASLPSIGQIGSGGTLSSEPAELDLQGELERAFSHRKY